jgi:hypothetical protein
MVSILSARCSQAPLEVLHTKLPSLEAGQDLSEQIHSPFVSGFACKVENVVNHIRRIVFI